MGKEMYTGKEYRDYLVKNGYHVTDCNDNKYWASDWVWMNKIQRSGTVTIMFSGNVMDDETNVYRTFSIHPVGEPFEAYSVAIEAKY